MEKKCNTAWTDDNLCVHVRIYNIYIYVCVCACLYIYIYIIFFNIEHNHFLQQVIKIINEGQAKTENNFFLIYFTYYDIASLPG